MKFSYRTLGILLIIFSSIGLLLSFAGITVSWLVKPGLQQNLLELVDTLQYTLTNTGDGLIVLDSALDNVKGNLGIIVTTLENLDGTLIGVSSSLDTSADLVGDDLRQTIIETQIALSSASNSAELIDDTLSIISRIPFVGANYQPEVPLHTSLNTVAESMDEIPESLELMEGNLTETGDGLRLLNDNMLELSDEITKFDTDLEDSQSVLQEYRNIIDETEEQLQKFQKNLPRNLTLLAIFISGTLFSLAVAQSVTLFQGIAFIEGEKQVVNLADIRRE
jgi:methyl-accepting chemotaxis protein